DVCSSDLCTSKEVKVLMKKVTLAFFAVTGGTSGYLCGPLLRGLLGVIEIPSLISPYLGAVIGAIIFFLLSYFLAGYVVRFLKWIEDGLVKVHIVDLLFGAIGLILGLFVSYLIIIPITDMSLKVVSEILSLFFTIVLGYLGFQVGFRRREEIMGMVMVSRKERSQKVDEQAEMKEMGRTENPPRPKILDTSVIIDGRIADVIQTSFLEGTIIIPQ